jgi:hypothetical protein
VFQIDDVRWTPDRSIAIDVTVLPAGPGSAPNRIANPDVESGTSGWRTGGWHPELATFTWASTGANGSAHSLAVGSTVENDVEWATEASGLVPGRAHYLCGFLRGEDVIGGRGATLSLSGTHVHTADLHGTFDWVRRCRMIVPAATAVDVACRLGGFGFTTSGRMGCDDVSLFTLDSAFD